MSKLWRKHPATERQRNLFRSNIKRGTKPTQADVLIGMLRRKRADNSALELPEIMQAGIAQHGARFNELRSRGFEIENQLEHRDGAICSRYILNFDPELEAR